MVVVILIQSTNALILTLTMAKHMCVVSLTEIPHEEAKTASCGCSIFPLFALQETTTIASYPPLQRWIKWINIERQAFVNNFWNYFCNGFNEIFLILELPYSAMKHVCVFSSTAIPYGPLKLLSVAVPSLLCLSPSPATTFTRYFPLS
jgi:hypothetical protein